MLPPQTPLPQRPLTVPRPTTSHVSSNRLRGIDIRQCARFIAGGENPARVLHNLTLHFFVDHRFEHCLKYRAQLELQARARQQ